MKVADAVVAAAVVLMVVLVVDLAAATVEAATEAATATISRHFRKAWPKKIRLAKFERFRSCVRPALRFALLSRFRRVYRAFLFANLRLVRRSDYSVVLDHVQSTRIASTTYIFRHTLVMCMSSRTRISSSR